MEKEARKGAWNQRRMELFTEAWRENRRKRKGKWKEGRKEGRKKERKKGSVEEGMEGKGGANGSIEMRTHEGEGIRGRILTIL